MAKQTTFRMTAAQTAAVPNLYSFWVKGAALKPATANAFRAVRKHAKGDGHIKAASFQKPFGHIVAEIGAPSVAAFWAAFNK